jgi:GH35 family endo-1,4-beta-xylanase
MDLRYNFIGDGGIVQKDQIKIVDINGNGTNVGNGSFTVDSAFRIRMSLRLEKNAGEYASVLLMGTPPVTEGDWWRGLIRLDIGANQQNKLQLCIRDGTSEQCNFESFVEIPTDQPFTILFDDPQGKVMHVLDQNGKEVQKVDIPQQTGLTLPDGLFPTHTVWPGAWVNPQVTLYIDSFIAENAPSGKAKLEDLPELAAWVDDYVHAYDGQVTVNDVKMDSQQLTAAIRQDNTTFLQTKQINGKPTSFLVVNGIPLAIQKSGELWRKVYGRDLADALKIDLAMPGMFSDISDATYREILENANKITITADLNTSVVYGKFSAKDWRSVLDNWDMIQAQINDGVIPAGYPYNWDQAQPVILFAQSHNMKVRVQHLLTGGDSIADSILHGNYSKDELKKILEFTTSITVLKYKGVVDEWDIEDEQVNVDINKYSSGDYGFWLREVGLVDATELVARTVKKLDPGSKLIATEAFLVEEKLGTQGAILRDHFLAFLDDLQSRGVPLDGVDIENGEWVYNPPAPEFEKQFLQKIQSRGLYLSAPETIVVLTPDKYPFWYEPVEKTAVVTNPLESQADVFRDITLTYLDLGAKGIGFGDVGDKWAFLNYSGETDANPSLFDDDSRPKQAYCAVMKVLYDYLP